MKPIIASALFNLLFGGLLFAQAQSPTPTPPQLPRLAIGASAIRSVEPAPTPPVPPSLGTIASIKLTRTKIGLREIKTMSSSAQDETWYLTGFQHPAFLTRNIVVGVDESREPPQVFFDIFDPSRYADFGQTDFPELAWLASARFAFEGKLRGVPCNVFESAPAAPIPVEQPSSARSSDAVKRVWIAKHSSLPLAMQDGRTLWYYEFPKDKEDVQLPQIYIDASFTPTFQRSATRTSLMAGLFYFFWHDLRPP